VDHVLKIWLGGGKGGTEIDEIDNLHKMHAPNIQGHVSFFIKNKQRLRQAHRLRGWDLGIYLWGKGLVGISGGNPQYLANDAKINKYMMLCRTPRLKHICLTGYLGLHTCA